MSNKALTWAFEAPIDNVGAKFVLVALADHASDHAGEDWSCFPSNERLMEFTSMPLRTLERHISWLVAAGWITREKQRDRRGRLKDRVYRLRRNGPIIPDAVCPPAILAGGETASPPAKNPAHHPPNRGQKAPDLAGGHNKDEPPEPSLTPTPGARADENRAFEALVAAYPPAGIDNTDIPAARAAFGSEVAKVGDPWRLVEAARSYAADPKTKARSFAPPGLDRWLMRQSYLGRLPSPVRSDGLGEGVADLFGFGGPAEVRAALVATRGEGFVRSYLDRSRWEAATRTVVPPGGTARKALSEAWGPLMSMGVKLGEVKKGVA